MKKAPRLYKTLKPSHYNIHILLDRKKLTFSGSISLRAKKTGPPSQRLTLHQLRLKVASAEVIHHGKAGDVVLSVDRINTHDTLHEVRLHTKEKIHSGDYTINLTFSGKITDAMQGIYPSRFTHKNKEHILFATQFESNHAREAFPCIDEPEAKATFDLTITTDASDTVLSNMPEKSSKKEGSLQTITFETTPIMSSYLLAFAAGDIHNIEAKTKNGTIVRSWSTIASPTSKLQFSLDEGVKILEFFEDYFQIPFPLPKLDQIALPDFDAGAMENWGLITYREIALLADAENRSISNEQYVAMVVAHEISHQWFGNLVTMKWWDDLWLNESFASIMEHIALDNIHPEWQQWEHYVSSDVLYTTNRDIYKDIQPISVEVTDPDLIETLFDPGIVYAKGGRLLRMLIEFIGEEAFRKGLTAYFKAFTYSNATRDDLWKHLSDTSGENIGALMDEWLMKPGMPMVHVDQTGNDIKLSQERYLLDGTDTKSLWPIPLLADKTVEPKLFKGRTAKAKSNDGFVVFNTSGSGHYFVDYDNAEHRDYINTALASQRLSSESRINILNDKFMIARIGNESLVDGLKAIKDAEKEPREPVWTAISRIVATAAQLTEGDDVAESHLHSLRRKLGGYWYDKLGWEDKPEDDANTKQLRHRAIALMIGGEDEVVIAEALAKYEHAKNIGLLPAELRGIILVAAVRTDRQDIIDDLMTAYPSSPTDVQSDITNGLSGTKNPKTAEKILQTALGPKGFVRPQDLLRFYSSFLRNHHCRDVAWKYLVDNWKWFHETLEHSKSFDFLPIICSATMNTDEWAKRYKEFFEPLKKIKFLQKNIGIGESDIAAKIAWRKRDEAAVVDWLISEPR